MLLALRYVIPALMMEAHPPGSTASPYGYVEYVPPDPGPRPRPLLLVLHGGSSRGDGSHPRSIIHRLPPLRYVARARLLGSSSPLVDAGVLIAAPQSPGEWDAAKIDALLDYLLATHDIDRDRVYLTGPSMGGCGTWRYAAVHPERLAAAHSYPNCYCFRRPLVIHRFLWRDDSAGANRRDPSDAPGFWEGVMTDRSP
ncbi:hypothetical protein [Sorangium atrum]|uniref:Uncharacterized protein n=1 Tax=Sorangium atrum TaxID=2995308 RepID=A0ABT5C1L3_9BACT|nr:hypothetical protein [Sorangium aterium]MDC0679568.1 hypothetical protein [Sorangium aterium]